MNLILGAIATLFVLLGLVATQSIRVNSLYNLLLKLHFKYRKDVLCDGISYSRFANDCCNESLFIDMRGVRTVKELNERNKNYNIIVELLQQRSDLVTKYFAQEYFSYEDFLELSKEFNSDIEQTKIVPTDELSISNTTLLSYPVEEIGEPKKIVGDPNPFKCSFSPKEIELLTTCINEAHIFTTSITPAILKDFFSCTLNGVLKSNNNRLLAYLMMQLSNYDYISRNWQSVIACQEMIYKRRKDEYLTKNDLSTANDNGKYIRPQGSDIIDKYIKELKKG